MPSSNARYLRKNLTEAEKRLWSKLRNSQLDNLRFRRQAPIGPYVVDFVCFEKKLVIEVGGGQHASSDRDNRRTDWLDNQGFKVLRFWNNDVLAHTNGVVETILAALRET